MAIIKAVVLPAKRMKGNRNKVRISVAHNGATRYIPTDIIIGEGEFKNGQIVKRDDASYLNSKMRKSLNSLQLIIDDIDHKNGLTCSELVYMIEHVNDRKLKTVEQSTEDLLDVLRIKPNTVHAIKIAIYAFHKFMNGDTLLSDVNHLTILRYHKYLLKNNLSNGTIKNYMINLSRILKFAVRCQYVEYKIFPFDGYSYPDVPVRQSWLTVEQLRLIRDYKTDKRSEIVFRDIFMLSYYLGGINVVDLLKIDFGKCRKTGVLKYERSKTERIVKTNKYVEFKIPECAWQILHKYVSSSGKIEINDRRWYLTGTFFSRTGRQIQRKLSLGRLIYYSARKSFSQHAFNIGISTSVIDYMLGHALNQKTNIIYSYIKVTPDMATEALNKVIAYLNADKIAVENDDKSK